MPELLQPLDFEKGELLLVDKPLQWTSFDVVKKIRTIIKVKIGHAGTLDPLATGLLVLCTGKKTKDIAKIQDTDKEYTGTFFLGATTPSYDLETDINQCYDIGHITEGMITETVKKFEGEILQTPPVYSAVQVGGNKAYVYARKGKQVTMPPRKVNIKQLEILAIDLPVVKFRVECSKGTYIRSLADDFGKALNAGAYLSSLCRTRVGEYRLEEAWKLEELVGNLQKIKSPLK